jgi:hypothetical protein
MARSSRNLKAKTTANLNHVADHAIAGSPNGFGVLVQ